MATYSYTVLVSKENGGYRAYCPALPGCRSHGETRKEAVNNIKISISCRLETLKAKGKPIPKDGDLAPASQKAHSPAWEASGMRPPAARNRDAAMERGMC